MRKNINFFKWSLGLLFIFTFVSPVICQTTVDEKGSNFEYNKNVVIVPNKSKKNDILNTYGKPTEEKIIGKYHIIKYYYARKSLSHGRAIGQGLLGGLTGGLSNLFVDHGVKKSDMQIEYKEIVAYVDIVSGIVKDFYYHDSDLVGHDESESLLLKATDAEKKGGNSQQVRDFLEKAIVSNPNNYRALNNLAWKLIDSGDDVERGIMLAKKSVEIFPDSPYNNGTLGLGYLKISDFKNSEKYLVISNKLFSIYKPNDKKSIDHNLSLLTYVKEQINSNDDNISLKTIEPPIDKDKGPSKPSEISQLQKDE